MKINHRSYVCCDKVFNKFLIKEASYTINTHLTIRVLFLGYFI